jgi:hypothetical protein
MAEGRPKFSYKSELPLDEGVLRELAEYQLHRNQLMSASPEKPMLPDLDFENPPSPMTATPPPPISPPLSTISMLNSTEEGKELSPSTRINALCSSSPPPTISSKEETSSTL